MCPPFIFEASIDYFSGKNQVGYDNLPGEETENVYI